MNFFSLVYRCNLSDVILYCSVVYFFFFFFKLFCLFFVNFVMCSKALLKVLFLLQ